MGRIRKSGAERGDELFGLFGTLYQWRRFFSIASRCQGALFFLRAGERFRTEEKTAPEINS